MTMFGLLRPLLLAGTTSARPADSCRRRRRHRRRTVQQTVWVTVLRRPLQAALVVCCLSILIAVDLYGPSHHGDVNLYHRYAVTFFGAEVPFSRLPDEYPPLAMLAFTLTVLPPLGEYAMVFGLWMAAIFVAGFFVVQRLFSRQAAVLYLVYLVVGGMGTLLSRYDLLPALVTILALAAVLRGRFLSAYLLIAVGTLLKLYPLFLLPVVMLEHQRRLSWETRPAKEVLVGAAACIGVVAGGFAAAYLLAGSGALSPFGFARSRPFQVESVPASVLWLLSAGGFPVRYDHSFNSFNLISDAAGTLTVISNLGLLAGCLWVYWSQGRRGLPVERAFLAVVCVVLVTSRVFSPQYMIWVLPLVAIVEGFDLLWLALAVLTAAIWPAAYLAEGLHGAHHYYSPPFLALIAARNLLFIVATARILAWSPIRRRAERPVVALP
jgi:hypothetical protein